MDKWLDGWVGGWMDRWGWGRMSRGWVGGWIGRWGDVWMNGWGMDGWMGDGRGMGHRWILQSGGATEGIKKLNYAKLSLWVWIT